MRIPERATRIALSCLVPLLLVAPTALADNHEEAPSVAQGKKISIEYTLTLEEGQVADTNVGGAPLVYTMGAGQVLPSLEEALAGLHPGDSKKVSLTAEQGYGPVNPELFQKVPVDQVPEDARVVGSQLIAQSPGGERIPIRVHAIEEEVVVMDLNHPLAGQSLHFDVKILSVE